MKHKDGKHPKKDQSTSSQEDNNSLYSDGFSTGPRHCSKSAKFTANRLPSIFSSPFTKAQDNVDHLKKLLQGYTSNGLPKIPDLYIRGRPQYDPSSFQVEFKNWTDIVEQHETLTRRQKDQQEAIWELLTTEVEYIKKIRVVIDVFFCCLVNLQSAEHILTEINTKSVFGNIVDVFYATCHFWVNHMMQVLRVAKETREPLNPCLLKAGFLAFDTIFEPYTKYCLEQESCIYYIRERIKDNELFRTFILWGETLIQCSRLKLVDLIVRPWQRLTKYKLLLHAMRKPLDKMDVTYRIDEQIRDIDTMIGQVERFVYYVNMTMRKKQDGQQLNNMIDRIESYDAIDSLNEECDKLVSGHCRVDLILTCPVPGCSQQELRIVLLEGSLKLKDANSKIDVYCFLCTDLLLVTKPATKRSDKIRVIKPPMRLDKIIVYGLKDISSFLLLYLNEYHILQSAYTFHGDSIDSKVWIDNIKKAQFEYKEKRNLHMTMSESLILDMFDDGDDDYPSQLATAESSTAAVEVTSLTRGQPRPSSTEPNLESLQKSGSSSRLRRSLSFVNLSNPEPADVVAVGGARAGGSLQLRPRSAALGCDQKRSKSQTFLPGCSSASSKQLGIEELRGGGVDADESATSLEAKGTNYLAIPRALASMTGLFGDVAYSVNYGLLQSTGTVDVEEQLPRRDLVPFGGGDAYKTRLNQRRMVRCERRYFTADTIQDMKPKKPSPATNIHKHRSWNCRTTASTAAGGGGGGGAEGDCQVPLRRGWPSSSTDSVQSAYSSSGISSTASSMRISRESEICEETENELVMEMENHPDEEYYPEEEEDDDDDDGAEDFGGGLGEDGSNCRRSNRFYCVRCRRTTQTVATQTTAADDDDPLMMILLAASAADDTVGTTTTMISRKQFSSSMPDVSQLTRNTEKNVSVKEVGSTCQGQGQGGSSSSQKNKPNLVRQMEISKSPDHRTNV